ncbi:MAG: type 4a pilus biogenesis protein PilO [Syntrophobacteraceae bacterium]|jgi:type IV pilus assembly protein PilO|nr:type 4a pilus biogenesis protein PilO [Syntrophobacteraceae bacterium]
MKKDSASLGVLQEKLGELTPLQRLLLVLVTVLLLGGAFYFLKYKDQAQNIRRLQTSILEQQKKLETLKLAAVEVEKLQKELAQSEEQLRQVLSLLPDQKEIPGLLDNISQLGAEVGLENILFQPQPEQPREFHAAIPIRLDLVGTYHELGVFLDRVSKLDRILKVENLNLTRQKDGSTLQVGLTAVTYRFVDTPPQATTPPKKK